jgi:transposase InsO family protein
MKKETDEQKRIAIREFRCGVIAELCNPYLNRKQVRDLIKQKSALKYEIPFSSKTRISFDCIRKWLTAYRDRGIAGLEPKVRSDHGKSKSLTEEEQSVLISYLEDYPDVPATVALKVLQKKKKIISRISQSSLSRFVTASGLTRKLRLREKMMEKQLKFEFFHPLECVQVDVLHAFPVSDAKGRKRKALLMAAIDDATRRIVYARFAYTEKAVEFLRCIKHILMAHGRIGRIYVDNGSSFISKQVKRICNILGILLIHSRPRKPAGRGKIERFFRTLRDSFLRPLDKESVCSLDDLNIRFTTWLESEYHRNPHKGLYGKTPLEVWLEKAHLILTLPPDVNLDEVITYEMPRRVYGDNTFTLDGFLYEVPCILMGKNIRIRFCPFTERPPVHVYYDNKYYGAANLVDTYANTKIKRNSDTKQLSESSCEHKTSHISASLSASKIDMRKVD